MPNTPPGTSELPGPDSPLSPTVADSLPDLLCFSHLRWHFVTQRPQHLLTRAAREMRVFFWEEPLFDAAGDTGAPRLESLEEQTGSGEQLTILQPHLRPGSDADA